MSKAGRGWWSRIFGRRRRSRESLYPYTAHPNYQRPEDGAPNKPPSATHKAGVRGGQERKG